MVGQAKAKPKGVPKSFSTTGRTEEEEFNQPEGEGTESSAVVALEIKKAELGVEDLESVPERVLLGGGWRIACTIGRHEETDLVIPLGKVSKIHCQIALRAFRLKPGGPLHEAAFLRDVSKHGTLVNGFPAFKPWHWIQHGDILGLVDGAHQLEFCRIEYRQHYQLPGHMVTTEDIPGAKPTYRPPATPRQAVQPPPRLAQPFANEICGKIVDVSYVDEDPPATYRMRIVGYIAEEGFHHVDSEGLSTWDGESFDDTIDLNGMFAAGHIVFVDDARGNPQARTFDDEDAPLLQTRKKRKLATGTAKALAPA